MGIGAAIAGALFSSAAVATAAGIAIELGISLLASQILGKKPKVDDVKDQGRTGNVRSSIMPHEVVYGRVRKGGLMAYINGTGNKNNYLHMLVIQAAHEVFSISDYQFDGEAVNVDETGAPTTKYSKWARLLPISGAEDQAAHADMVAENDNWTDDHRARGRAGFYARLKWDAETYSSFIPKITSVIKGKQDVYDPRDGSEFYTENPALIAADILETYLNIPRERIDTATLAASASACDELVETLRGALEPRYSASGYFLLEGSVEDWLEGPVKAMAGGVVEHGGIYYIHAGKWNAPELTITDDDIIGSINVVTAKSDSERHNVAKGSFVAAETYDQPTDFPAYKNAAAIADDGGVENEMELDLEWVDSASQAQRVAKIILMENRQDEQIEIEITLEKGLDLKPWDTITLASDVLGINGTYRVTNHVVDISSGENPRISVKLTLKAHDATVYDWDYLTEELEYNSTSLTLPGDDDLPEIISFDLTPAASSTGSLNLGSLYIDFAHSPGIVYDHAEIETVVAGQYRATGSSDAWQDTEITNIETEPAANTDHTQTIQDALITGDFDIQNVFLISIRLRLVFDDNSTTPWAIVNGDEQASAVHISPNPGTDDLIDHDKKITLTADAGDVIRYTIDDDAPETRFDGEEYTGPFLVSFDENDRKKIVRARAFRTGALASPVSSQKHTWEYSGVWLTWG